MWEVTCYHPVEGVIKVTYPHNHQLEPTVGGVLVVRKPTPVPNYPNRTQLVKTYSSNTWMFYEEVPDE